MKISNVDKLIRHYQYPNDYPLTQELEAFQDRLDYTRTVLKRYDRDMVWRMLVKKFNCSRSMAYIYIRECKEFFATDFSEKDLPFERVVTIEKLEKIYRLALEAATNSRDFAHCAKIQMQIADLKGLLKESDGFDPALLKPTVINILVPTGGKGRPRSYDVSTLKEDESNEVINLIEGIHYSVDDMKKSLEDHDRKGE